MPTAKKKTDVEDQLRALVRLQHIDNRIDQIEKLRGNLPEEIQDLEDEEAGLKTRLENHKEEVQEQKVAKRQAELDIKEAEGLIDKYEEQQLEVRNNREFDALTKEIEGQEERIAEAEETIEEAEETIETRKAAIEDTEERLEELDEVLDEKREELDEVVEDTEDEEATLEELREQAAEKVGSRYLKAYSKLRDRLRDGRAVVPLKRGAAAGFSVPPQRQVEIRKRKSILTCEHTGRIIVDQELYNETVDEMKEKLDL
ncbi:MAG: zinc ribbon domain-containing protein [Salinibacter sp.]|uniref:zinc ribbon domain-containing protein n=1 Tax=Salinibacter sp. TaxID=2065818 RepID=UPI0035D4A11B